MLMCPSIIIGPGARAAGPIGTEELSFDAPELRKRLWGEVAVEMCNCVDLYYTLFLAKYRQLACISETLQPF